MFNYYAHLKKLWVDLVNYDLLPVTKDKNVINILTKRHEEFLMGLDSNFRTIRSSILNENPLIVGVMSTRPIPKLFKKNEYNE